MSRSSLHSTSVAARQFPFAASLQVPPSQSYAVTLSPTATSFESFRAGTDYVPVDANVPDVSGFHSAPISSILKTRNVDGASPRRKNTPQKRSLLGSLTSEIRKIPQAFRVDQSYRPSMDKRNPSIGRPRRITGASAPSTAVRRIPSTLPENACMPSPVVVRPAADGYFGLHVPDDATADIHLEIAPPTDPDQQSITSKGQTDSMYTHSSRRSVGGGGELVKNDSPPRSANRLSVRSPKLAMPTLGVLSKSSSKSTIKSLRRRETLSPGSTHSEPESVEANPQPSVDYRKMGSPPRRSRSSLPHSPPITNPAKEPSFASELHPVQALWRDLNAMPWISPGRITRSYCPGLSRGKMTVRRGKGRKKIIVAKPSKSWYASMRTSVVVSVSEVTSSATGSKTTGPLDLLSSGTVTSRTTTVQSPLSSSRSYGSSRTRGRHRRQVSPSFPSLASPELDLGTNSRHQSTHHTHSVTRVSYRGTSPSEKSPSARGAGPYPNGFVPYQFRPPQPPHAQRTPPSPVYFLQRSPRSTPPTNAPPNLQPDQGISSISPAYMHLVPAGPPAAVLPS